MVGLRKVLRDNYRSRNLIGHYQMWVINPRNSTSSTGLFLAGRRARAGHETSSTASRARHAVAVAVLTIVLGS